MNKLALLVHVFILLSKLPDVIGCLDLSDFLQRGAIPPGSYMKVRSSTDRVKTKQRRHSDIRRDFQLIAPMQTQSVENDLDHTVVFPLCDTK